MFYTLSDTQLKISDNHGVTLWLAKPDGLPVLDILLTLDRESVFVLLDPPSGTGRTRNIVKVTRAGQVEWRGELPTGDPTDFFVSLGLGANGEIIASTWSGYAVRLSPDTGHLLSAIFTK